MERFIEAVQKLSCAMHAITTQIRRLHALRVEASKYVTGKPEVRTDARGNKSLVTPFGIQTKNGVVEIGECVNSLDHMVDDGFKIEA